MKYLKFLIGFSSLFILTSCSQVLQDEVNEEKEEYESRGRINEEGSALNEDGQTTVTIEGATFTLPDGWNSETVYIGGADIELQNQKEGSMMDLTMEGNVKISANDEERLVALPEITSGEWFELPCGMGAWCYYVNVRDTTYFLTYGLDYVEGWDQFEEDLYGFFNSMEITVYDSGEGQLNTEVFDLGLSTLEEYFALTDAALYESEYGAGYLFGTIAPEGYVLIRDEDGEPKKFLVESDYDNNFVWIYAQEGYETKEEVTFYLNRVAGPRSELYGPFSADLMSLLTQ